MSWLTDWLLSEIYQLMENYLWKSNILRTTLSIFMKRGIIYNSGLKKDIIFHDCIAWFTDVMISLDDSVLEDLLS